MEGPAIAIVRSPRRWASDLHRYVADYGGAVVRARPLEERQALEVDYDVLIIDDISSFLTARLVQELHGRRRKILGVFDPAEHVGDLEGAGEQRLRNMGIDDVIVATSAPEEFLRMIQAVAPSWDADSEFDKLVSGFQGEGPAPDGGFQRGDGKLTVVLGAAGGVGATEVAIELGRIVRRRGEVGVIVDGDDVYPAIAQRLGLPLHPNIRTAIDAIESGSGLLADCLLTAPGGQATVLCGIAHPKDWAAIRPEEVLAVVKEFTRVCHHVIVNVAASLEDLGGLGGIDRFGLARILLGEADTVILVGNSSPVGVSRILDQAANLTTVAPTASVHVVINRAPAEQFKRGELIQEIQRNYAPSSMHFVPFDRKVEVAAWQGRLVESGVFTAVIAELGKLVLVTEGSSKAKRRFAPKFGAEAQIPNRS